MIIVSTFTDPDYPMSTSYKFLTKGKAAEFVSLLVEGNDDEDFYIHVNDDKNNPTLIFEGGLE